METTTRTTNTTTTSSNSSTTSTNKKNLNNQETIKPRTAIAIATPTPVIMTRSLFKDYGNRQRQRPQDEVTQMMKEVTQTYMEEMERDSMFFATNPRRRIATFDPSEIEVNKRIGMGEFGTILEVSNIALNESYSPASSMESSSSSASIRSTVVDVHEDEGDETMSTGGREGEDDKQQLPQHILHNSKSCVAFPVSDYTTTTTATAAATDWNENPACESHHHQKKKDLLILQQVQQLRHQLANKVLREEESSCNPLEFPTVASTFSSPSSLQSLHLHHHRHHLAMTATTMAHSPANSRSSSNASSNGAAVRRLLRSRFAVKQIRKDLYPKKKIEAGKDLAREAQFLSHLEHPNIIRLRATVGRPGDEDFMLLLDRLGTSLSEQVTQWHQRAVSGGTNKGGGGFPWTALSSSTSSYRKEVGRGVLAERLLALYDVARAMQYLHQKSILFRDLKTENVARNHHGAFQLLDFGLAKELKKTNRVGEVMVTDRSHSVGGGGLLSSSVFVESLVRSKSNDFLDDTYKLTGLTGTLRIMSPEVLSCQPYGLSADVYSFGIVIWEVFHGDRNRLSAADVVKGERPELPVVGMPPRVESLIKKCYGSPAFRPTFAMLSQELEYQLLELQQQQEEGWQQQLQQEADDALQHIYLDQDHSHHPHDHQGSNNDNHATNIFHRLEYLRQLSIQSLTTTATTAAASVLSAVEN